jgi:hypothetical protein
MLCPKPDCLALPSPVQPQGKGTRSRDISAVSLEIYEQGGGEAKPSMACFNEQNSESQRH